MMASSIFYDFAAGRISNFITLKKFWPFLSEDAALLPTCGLAVLPVSRGSLPVQVPQPIPRRPRP